MRALTHVDYLMSLTIRGNTMITNQIINQTNLDELTWLYVEDNGVILNSSEPLLNLRKFQGYQLEPWCPALDKVGDGVEHLNISK